MKLGYQTTLRDRVEISGLGVHSGAPARLILHPADVDTGIIILRTGLPNGRERLIEAKWSNVTQTSLCTVIGDTTGAAVSTVEHVMAALAGLHVDNALVEIDGAEMPIMDGSAVQFVDAIDAVGLAQQSRPRRYIRVLRPVRVESGRSYSELRPASRGFRLDVEIDFDTCTIGRQRRVFDLSPEVFRKDIARARTFGFVSDVKKLWQAGFALGSSLENSVALDGEAILNPEGLRFADEFVRHKTLDAIGDLSLAGAPIIGCYHAYRPGHTTNAMKLAALFADRQAYEIIEGAPRKVYSAGAGAVARMATAFAANAD
ncbi:MAG: UDP-3-O-acyl-N-acetylglucosamine deacetylase [Hyphomicrobiales bacterium]|nr:UDP-3-O-acyl-N-acetylglucosamine deacetylase [Hyphomicrobiales bacterium]